jgi:hypothetical protein
MLTLRCIAIPLACLLLGSAHSVRAHTSSACMLPDPVSAAALRTLTKLVTSADSVDVAYRTQLNIPATQAANVTLATDSRTCQKGVDAFNAFAGTASLARSLWVYKIDTAFAVEDPTFGNGGEYRTLVIFDRKWRYQGTMLTF